jgi:hypothetical protein
MSSSNNYLEKNENRLDFLTCSNRTSNEEDQACFYLLCGEKFIWMKVHMEKSSFGEKFIWMKSSYGGEKFIRRKVHMDE